MSRLNCQVTEDLLPIYVEELVSGETRMLVDEHLAECKECRENMLRMSQELDIHTETPKINRKFLIYLKSVRLWYFLCPALGIFALGTRSDTVISYFTLFLSLISIAFLSSYFSGLSYGIDYDQVKLKKAAENREKKKWGIFKASPLSLALPSLITLLIFILVDLLFGWFHFNIFNMLSNLARF